MNEWKMNYKHNSNKLKSSNHYQTNQENNYLYQE